MKNISIKSQNLMMILFLLLINILAFMSVDTTDNEWIILFASSEDKHQIQNNDQNIYLSYDIKSF